MNLPRPFSLPEIFENHLAPTSGLELLITSPKQTQPVWCKTTNKQDLSKSDFYECSDRTHLETLMWMTAVHSSVADERDLDLTNVVNNIYTCDENLVLVRIKEGCDSTTYRQSVIIMETQISSVINSIADEKDRLVMKNKKRKRPQQSHNMAVKPEFYKKDSSGRLVSSYEWQNCTFSWFHLDYEELFQIEWLENRRFLENHIVQFDVENRNLGNLFWLKRLKNIASFYKSLMFMNQQLFHALIHSQFFRELALRLMMNHVLEKLGKLNLIHHHYYGKLMERFEQMPQPTYFDFLSKQSQHQLFRRIEKVPRLLAYAQGMPPRRNSQTMTKTTGLKNNSYSQDLDLLKVLESVWSNQIADPQGLSISLSLLDSQKMIYQGEWDYFKNLETK